MKDSEVINELSQRLLKEQDVLKEQLKLVERAMIRLTDLEIKMHSHVKKLVSNSRCLTYSEVDALQRDISSVKNSIEYYLAAYPFLRNMDDVRRNEVRCFMSELIRACD